jgi:ATP-dependent Clp protease ATP-binding subunit ClpA
MGGKLFRKQFSMFQNNDYVTYLFGGEHSENSFAKEVLEREANVLLLDEFDKVNPIFHSAFYQLFDEGIFEDNNYSIDAGGAIIICTSNYLSEEEIKNKLGEPIYSRFETCIKYDELSPESVKKIIKICIEREWNNLSPEDKYLIDKETIEKGFNKHSSKITNARMVDNTVKQVISDKILDRIISQNHGLTED